MGLRGPAPTPTKVLEARGSWRAKERDGEPQLPVRAPSCPAWLGDEAKAEWRRQVKHLKAMGVVAEADRAMLAAYCEAWAEFVAGVAFVEEHGHTITTEKGNVIQHPMVGVKNKAIERMAKIAAQFGFTPSARVRLARPEEGKEGDGKSRFFANAG